VGEGEGGDHSGDLRTGYVGLAGRAVTGSAPNQLSTGGGWASGALSAVGAGEEVVAASEYRALQQQVREFQAAARKKTLENEIPAPSADLVQKTTVARFTKSVGPAEGGR